MGKEGASSRQERFRKLREAPQPPAQSSKPKIQKVPFMLHGQKHFEKYYEPRAVAIGPFHHGKPRCQLAEEFKLMLTSWFIKSNGLDDEVLYKKIEEKIQQFRECYVEEATKDIDDEDLAWMLFLDGCATLQFIHSFMQEELEKLFKIKRDQIAFAQQDLFLLENQIPYRALVLLMNSCQKHEDLQQSIDKFIQAYIIVARTEKQSIWNKLKQKLCIAAKPEQNQQGSITASKYHNQQGSISTSKDQNQQLGEIIPIEKVIDMDNGSKDQNQQLGEIIPIEVIDMDNEPIHLLDLLRTRMLGQSKKDDSSKDKVTEFSRQSFRTVQELTAAGVYFYPSKTDLLGDITFDSNYAGRLSLPPIAVDDSTGPKFMNLIAYEMCPDFQNDYGVTSYIGFLDALIDHAEDVKKLRSEHVLYNLLGSDKEVARLFNEIGTDLVPNTAIYLNVKADIEKHYQTVWKTWISQCYHTHFSSPWTFIAFLGVLSALGLTAIQTWYTVYAQPSPCDVVCQYMKSRLHLP